MNKDRYKIKDDSIKIIGSDSDNQYEVEEVCYGD